MDWSVIANLILGGGLLSAVAAILTLRSTVAKAKAEAERVRIDNTEQATRILVENIVQPLKVELNATREDLQATKREMASTKREMGRLRKAVEAAGRCPHSDGCPVLLRLSDGEERDGVAGQDPQPRRRVGQRSRADPDGTPPGSGA